ncbi:hypothetical protein [Ectopseudomonas hydrolytica]|uniref:hypothetical protein n=1 Tax=Ectopseudomonas hydrolytica TaxID=2493633 RepID=UPI00376F2B80
MHDNPPLTVFICNTSLHIMNAMDACVAFNIDAASAWLVIKTVPAAPANSIKPVVELAPWGRVIWVGDVPVEGRGFFSFIRYQLAQYKYYRAWQQELKKARGVSRVFLSFNRMIANRIIASWLRPREVVWLDDGTLSYALALDSVLPPAKKKVMPTGQVKRLDGTAGRQLAKTAKAIKKDRSGSLEKLKPVKKPKVIATKPDARNVKVVARKAKKG